MTMMDAALRYAELGMAVISVLPRSKTPATTNGVHDASRDPQEIREMWGERPDNNVGIACGAASLGLIAIDLDVDDAKGVDGWAALRAWENEHGALPETASTLTGRGGGHLLYRTIEDVHCSVNGKLGIDVRADGGYIVAPPSVHPSGRTYAWENDPSDVPVAVADSRVLDFLAYVQGGRAQRRRMVLPDVIDDMRNDTLFRWGASLRSGRDGRRGLDDRELLDELLAVNRQRCSPPLGEAEVRTIAQSLTRYDVGEGNASGAHRRARYDHVGVAQRLRDERGACIIDGSLAVRRKGLAGVYTVDPIEVRRAIVEVAGACTDANRTETLRWLEIVAPRREQNHIELVAFANAVVDVRTGEAVDMPSDAVLCNVVPHEWRGLDAEPGAADEFLHDLADGDMATELNLAEIVGLALYRNSTAYGIAPVLLGGGGCGKSTYLKALREVVGRENTSMLTLDQIGSRFRTGEMEGALLNVGDDTPVAFSRADELAIFKKAVTGEVIPAEAKYQTPHTFRPRALVVLSANDMPRLEDATSGMMRRLFPIVFTRRFAESGTANPFLLDELLADESFAARLLALGVQGLQRVFAFGGMTPNERGAAELAEIKEANDTVLMWLDGFDGDFSSLIGRAQRDLRDEYAAWAAGAGVMPVKLDKFGRRLVDAVPHSRFVNTTVMTSHGRRKGRFFRIDEMTADDGR